MNPYKGKVKAERLESHCSEVLRGISGSPTAHAREAAARSLQKSGGMSRSDARAAVDKVLARTQR